MKFNSEYIKNKDGSWTVSVDLTRQEQEIVYKAACAANTLTLTELLYQAAYQGKQYSLRRAIIAAFLKKILVGLTKVYEKESKRTKRKTKKSKTS